jgi:response regulator of citrate/malate metabolism
MKKSMELFQDYYGATYFLKNNMDKKLIIFLIDDDPFYLMMAGEELSKNTNFKVLKFPTGEDALIYSKLQPDLILIDFHLDSVNPKAKNGAVISKMFKVKCPDSEIMIITSDHKLSMMQDIAGLNNQKFHIKGDNNNLLRVKIIKHRLKSSFDDYQIDRMTKITAVLSIIFIAGFIIYANY